MIRTILSWLKEYGAREAIREMDKLEPIFAQKIKEAQNALGNIPPHEFAKILVDEVQVKLCTYFKVDPKSIGL